MSTRVARKYCLQCCGGSIGEIQKCPSVECPFWPTRLGKGRTRLRSIREVCLDCSAGSAYEVRACDRTDCALWSYRLGRRPGSKDPLEKRRADAHVSGPVSVLT